jgi:hypothetical protein
MSAGWNASTARDAAGGKLCRIDAPLTGPRRSATIRKMAGRPEMIYCKFYEGVGAWISWRNEPPGVAAHGGDPQTAVRRLFETCAVTPGRYLFVCDTDRSGGCIDIIWRPPQLLFPCAFCQQHGDIHGRRGREVCPKCGGLKRVPV